MRRILLLPLVPFLLLSACQRDANDCLDKGGTWDYKNQNCILENETKPVGKPY